jgi:putative nucleotidyltransferase with HDIG domain
LILISDPDQKWSAILIEAIKANKLVGEVCNNGKECQLSVYKKNPKAVVLDIETHSHGAFEVLKYLKLNYPLIRIILTFPNNKKFKELELSDKELKAMGIAEYFIKPYTTEKLIKGLATNHLEAWKDITSTDRPTNPIEEKEVSIRDDEFTRIKLDSFLTGNTSIFDCYVRLSQNKYVKVLYKGDSFNEEQLKRYSTTGKSEYLYFKTKDRAQYINYMNKILEKSISLSKGNALDKLNNTQVVVEKFIEEINVQGLRPELIEEGIKICQNMYNLVQKDKGLNKILSEYKEFDASAYSHLFLTSLFSTLICKNLEWATNRSVEMIAMGSLLHDIGKMKLPEYLRTKKICDMRPEEYEIYKSHPLNGVELLDKYKEITNPIKQIIYQHHEYVNGSGFPNGLTGVKIYPLAKVLSLSNMFAEIIIDNHVTPLDGLKILIPDKDLSVKFDSVMLKSLVAGFVRNK